MKRSIVTRALLAACAFLVSSHVSPARAQATQRIEIFGGYSYVREPVPAESGYFICPGTGCDFPDSDSASSANLNGWELSATYRVHRFLGVAADFRRVSGTSSQKGTLDINNSFLTNERLHLDSYLFGPQISLPGRIAPFAQVLIGAADQTGTLLAPQYDGSTSPLGNCFAAAFGGGLDLKLSHHLAIRPIQFRELLTRFGSSTQYQPEISAGIVLHL